MAAAPAPRKGRPKALINPDSCTGCEVCVAVCPVDCIPLDPSHPETKDELQQKYLRLMAQKQSG